MKKFYRVDDSTSSVEYLIAVFGTLNLDPPYQREGDIWSRDKKRLFIDSLINGFDVPKFYFNRITRLADNDGSRLAYRYDVVDGKQRLQALYEFFAGEYALADDFKYFDDEDINLAGLSCSEIKSEHPGIYADLCRYRFDIIVFDGLAERRIDEFFIRLNEGVALNAQERRAAMSSALSAGVRDLAKSNCFAKRCLRRRARYKNDEIIAKYVLVVEMLEDENKILDTKKGRLDAMYKRAVDGVLDDKRISHLLGRVKDTLEVMDEVFQDEDRLLYSIGNAVIYFYAACEDLDSWGKPDVRDLLEGFEAARREVAQTDPSEWSGVTERFNWMLVDYNGRVQSINDGSAITYRARCINAFIRAAGNKEVFCQAMDDLEDELL